MSDPQSNLGSIVGLIVDSVLAVASAMGTTADLEPTCEITAAALTLHGFLSGMRTAPDPRPVALWRRRTSKRSLSDQAARNRWSIPGASLPIVSFS
jgi:hypothetical protein